MNNDSLIKSRKNSKPSLGEKEVANFLTKRNIVYKREYFHKKLKNDLTGSFLFFDFYIKKYNLFIEVDGVQHYKAIHGEENFFYQQYKDKLKNSFCKKHHIKLIRLTYPDLVSMEKLSKYLNSFNLKSRTNVRRNNCKLKKEITPKIKKKNKTIGVARRLKAKIAINDKLLEEKRNLARLSYPTDVRIYLAEKENPPS